MANGLLNDEWWKNAWEFAYGRLRSIFWRGFCPQDAADAVQQACLETFGRYWDGHIHFRDEHHLCFFVGQRADRRYRDRLRVKRRTVPISETTDTRPRPAQEIAVVREELDRIRECYNRLEPGDRRLLELKYGYPRKLAQIGRIYFDLPQQQPETAVRPLGQAEPDAVEVSREYEVLRSREGQNLVVKVCRMIRKAIQRLIALLKQVDINLPEQALEIALSTLLQQEQE